ncbi:helix-turn-helix transcriptional regulator [Paracoccus caeni]|uniref:Helix-turn-helix transcriptional regulator n=1 Tax=Paracoccus caeni TaxID=657651 RepID=A0A934SGV6_9RHOB|nr:AraC family transcriptional regulator [Paracoccus caeni]MBK4216821.1 helix-turn-helix transcriptional regulator [Paracoccus caeni]
MSYRHSMTCYTEGIQATLPVKWRSLDGVMSVYWEAEGQTGARGYYLSPDPRIVFFFNDVSAHIQMSNRDNPAGADARPMTRAVYVPAGMPLWTRFTAAHRFTHLDLHLHKDRLLRFLSPSLGESAALSALRRPVEMQQVDAATALAGLLVDEVASPARHAIYAESLVGSIAANLLDIPQEAAPVSGGLTPVQLSRLRDRVDASRGQRLSVAEMASVVGLSESWFASMFKKTTGKTPLQWQLGQRIERAQHLLAKTTLTLAEVADQLGFADQAHLTKSFRQVTGETPAAWRRMQGVI